MKKAFQQLIIDYRHSIDEAVKLLRKHAKQFDNYKEIRKGVFDEEKEASFLFHGIGCLVIIDKVEIDFDFANSIASTYRYDGIDPWFLWYYWKSKRSEYPEIIDYNKVKETLFAALVEENFLVKGDEKEVYFIKTDLKKYTNERVLQFKDL